MIIVVGGVVGVVGGVVAFGRVGRVGVVVGRCCCWQLAHQLPSLLLVSVVCSGFEESAIFATSEGSKHTQSDSADELGFWRQ